MIRYLYEWIQNLAFYMILITAIWNILPENSYKKYIRFFTGLVMVLMLAAPLTELFQVRGEMQLFYGREEARQQEEIEKKMQEYLRELETIEMPEMPEGAGGNDVG